MYFDRKVWVEAAIIKYLYITLLNQFKLTFSPAILYNIFQKYSVTSVTEKYINILKDEKWIYFLNKKTPA